MFVYFIEVDSVLFKSERQISKHTTPGAGWSSDLGSRRERGIQAEQL